MACRTSQDPWDETRHRSVWRHHVLCAMVIKKANSRKERVRRLDHHPIDDPVKFSSVVNLISLRMGAPERYQSTTPRMLFGTSRSARSRFKIARITGFASSISAINDCVHERPKFDCLIFGVESALTSTVMCELGSSEYGGLIRSVWLGEVDLVKWQGSHLCHEVRPFYLQRFDSSWMSVSSSLPVVTSRRNASRCQRTAYDHLRIFKDVNSMHTSEFRY